MVWYDKHRKCQDGTLHEGRLELMTWEGKGDAGEQLGFAGVFIEEAEEMRQTFEVKYKGDEARFYQYWPQGFRWTCCGCTGDMEFGCDHHGSGSTPCCCDFCHMGKPLPDSIYMQNQQATRGLQLRRGPDPRSYDPVKAGIAAAGRGLYGMPMGSDEDQAGDAPFAKNLDAVKMITQLFSQSPAAAAQFAQLQRDLQAGGTSSGASASSSSGGRAAGGSSSSSSKAGKSKAARSSSGGGGKAAAGASAAGVKTWACTVCGVEKPVGQMFSCSGCKAIKMVPYCSRPCQVADWPHHKAACKQAQQQAGAARKVAGASG